MDSHSVQAALNRAAPPPVDATKVGLVGIGFSVTALLAGGITSALGVDPGSTLANGPRALLAVFGLLTAGMAVAIAFRSTVLVQFAIAAGIAYFGFPASWDSGRMVSAVLGVVALAAVGMLQLSVGMQRLVVSILILFHFGGILTAVTSPPPQPWLTNQVWTRIYRPYLQFVYLNNAYHFYSPDPGPATLLWICIDYTDGTSRWLKLPKRPDDIKDPLSIEYYRRLSISEQTNQLIPPPQVRRIDLNRALQRRNMRQDIKFHSDIPQEVQYRVPRDEVRRLLLPSYARYIANAYARPGTEIIGIRIYRVEHRIIAPQHLLKASPYHPITFLPYYQGRYNAQGELMDPDDPMLFWLVPIQGELKNPEKYRMLTPPSALDQMDEYKIVDYVKIHAGSNHEEE